MCLLWENNRQPFLCKNAKEAFARRVCTIIGEIIAIPLYFIDPTHIAAATVFRYRFAAIIKCAPRHKLFYILDLDVVGIYCFDVSEQVFGKRPAVGVTGLAAFGFGEVCTFE